MASMEEVLPNAIVPGMTGYLSNVSKLDISNEKYSNARRQSLDLGPQMAVATTANRQFEAQKEEILYILSESGDEATRDKILDGSYAFTFLYKKRKCIGGAIHIASLQRDGELLERLLEMKADINAECKYRAFEKEGRAKPIHLAVQGCLENVQLLMNAGADINARVLLDGKEHFCPLHDAVFFRDMEVVRYLLDCMASVDETNLDGMTALHVAAKMGASDLAELLARYGADMELRDNSRRTALEVAVESGVFPQRRLHLLARFRIGDILTVSDHCPGAATEFIRNLLCDFAGAESADAVAHRPQVANELQKEDSLSVAHWILLLEQTPDAADYLLEILTVEPDEDSVYHHPLPNQARLKELRADYNTDLTWKCDTEQGVSERAWPEWHDRLSPGARRNHGAVKNQATNNRFSRLGNGYFSSADRAYRAIERNRQLVPVHMRQLRFRGVVCSEVLLALSETKYVDIFRNPAIVALLQYCWEAFVMRWYMLQVVHRVIELLVLSGWTYTKGNSAEVPYWQRRLSWTILLESAARDTFFELVQAYAAIFTLRGPGSYFGKVGNYVDMAVIVSFNVLVARASMQSFHLDDWQEFFAVLVFLRWFQMLFTLRAFKLGGIGVKGIIPILHSVKKIGGMMIICSFVFAGFFHAFLVLDNGVAGGPWEVLINTMKLLFMVDGDGIVGTLKLGGRGDAAGTGDYITAASLLIAVIIFCISLLNLFIAVHGRAYSEAHAHATDLFLQERSSICLSCMVQPQLPCLARGRCWLVFWCILSFILLGLWVLCIVIEDCPAWLAAFILFFAFYLLNGCLLAWPWASEEVRRESFLWWCAPSGRKYGNSGEEAESERLIEDMAERLVRLEKHVDELRLGSMQPRTPANLKQTRQSWR
ncbi:unnamed protein product [Effrenium voratum]|uniref:Ion transport domain-containing protein n=2 Tax=Effrenium voratum TaxID=2562239 RepID=A0AA36HJX5_9DINO|nr:unnamed protein product [Effrenium voratum]